MAPMFAYTVTARFETEAVAEEWVQWLEHGHLQAVLDAGAQEAALLRHDARHYEARYLFASRAAFDAYEAGPAIALRAEGAAKFPPSRGITMTRASSTLVLALSRKS